MKWKLLEVTNETGKWVRPVIRGTDVILLARGYSLCKAGTRPRWKDAEERGSAIGEAGLQWGGLDFRSLPHSRCLSLLPTCTASQDLQSKMPHLPTWLRFTPPRRNKAATWHSELFKNLWETGGDMRRTLVITLRIKRWGFLGPVFLSF